VPLSEAVFSAWLFAFARLAGWALLDPLTGRLPWSLRLMLAAVLAAALAPGLGGVAASALSLQGVLALALEAAWGALLALAVWLVFAAVRARGLARRARLPRRERAPAGGRRAARQLRGDAGRTAAGRAGPAHAP